MEDVDHEKEIKNYGDSFVTAKQPLKQSTRIEEEKEVAKKEVKQTDDIYAHSFKHAETDGMMNHDQMRNTVLSSKSSYFFRHASSSIKPYTSMKLGGKKVLIDTDLEQPFDSDSQTNSHFVHPARNTFNIAKHIENNGILEPEHEESKFNSKLFEKRNESELSDLSINNRDNDNE